MALRELSPTIALRPESDSPAEAPAMGVDTLQTSLRQRPQHSDQDPWRSANPTSGWGDPTSAVRAREAGRAIASTIDKAEYLALRRERALLAVKSARGEIQRLEERRLAVLDWELDRIEDSIHGPQMDRYGILARSVRQLGEDLQAIASQIKKRR